MTRFTKQAICASFTKLLNDRPLSQITVKDIVDDCGINRKTFYYYYQDIYALIDDLFKSDLVRIKETLPTDVEWPEAHKALANELLKNKTAVLHIYHSMDDTRLEQTAYEIGMHTIPKSIRARLGNMEVEDSDLNLIASLSASALAGFLVRWVHDGMKDNPNTMIDRAAAVMEGTTELALANAAKLKMNQK
ncbi:MAG: TetR-like C-terminal domain-containing protein [Lachnospiraceae bacterium]|nr:TetR-like C-terminal domain-containing protein [Lachnospiraceae bacterium]